ncbi:MAG: FeoB small GTPase domain-containing protein [Candidatus Nanopelagicales bacterium]
MSCHEPAEASGSTLISQARIALIGSPNAGKTTLINQLTGLRAKTGNYPGVTASRRTGEASVSGNTVTVEDLPGTYSLSPVSPDEQVATSYQLQHSVAGSVGRAVEPVFAPLGFNWEINVALIASMSASEVFVSTLGQITAAQCDDDADITTSLQNDTNPDGKPVYSPGTVAAILVFFVFALQCMSTIAVMRRETNSRRWPLLAFCYMFALAWVGGFIANTVVTAITS